MTKSASPSEQPKPKPKRQRREPEYILQEQSEDAGTFADHVGAPVFTDAAEARKHIRDNSLTGKFRIVRVVDEVNAESVTVTKIKLS